jgi:hypothetical protein
MLDLRSASTTRLARMNVRLHIFDANHFNALAGADSPARTPNESTSLERSQ